MTEQPHDFLIQLHARILSSVDDVELATVKRIIFDLFLGQRIDYKQRNPVGIILGGQPASGKTGLIRQIEAFYAESKFVVINGDEFRVYHPRYKEISQHFGQDAPKYTQPFSNLLVEYLKAECLRRRCNFIIEGTMRTYTVIEQTAREIKQAGFRCEAHVLAVHRHDSLLGVFQRFEQDKQLTGVGRFSPVAIHDEAYDQIPQNLVTAIANNLFDRLTVYTRTADGQLASALDHAGNVPAPPDLPTLFTQLRQPIFGKPFYRQQWLALRSVAQNWGETEPAYLAQLDEMVAMFS